MNAVVLIGNSDDKLPQRRWAEYVRAAGEVVARYARDVHFAGSSWPQVPWQNACWVFESAWDNLDALRVDLAGLARDYEQESVCLLMDTAIDFVRGR